MRPCLGYAFGAAFEDNHTLAFLLAFGVALSITALIELIRWARDRGTPTEATIVDAIDDVTRRLSADRTDCDGPMIAVHWLVDDRVGSGT